MKRALVVLLSLLALAAAAQPKGAPVIPAPRPWVPPTPQVRTLACGATAWVAERPGVPLVSLVVSAPAGSMRDGRGQRGLAMLVARVMEEGGAGARSGSELLAAFDVLGAELNAGASEESATFSVVLPAAKLEPVLALLVDVLARPRFEAQAFGSARQRQLAEFTAMEDEPNAVSWRLLSGQLYGSGPRAHPALGVPADVGQLTLEAARAFYAAHYGSAGLSFSVAGDVTADRFQKLFDGLAAKPWGGAAPVVFANPTDLPPAAWVGFDKPGAAQTVVLLGRVFPSVTDPAVPPTELVATVVGGSFTSRLVQNLREAHGYSYGAWARLLPGRDSSLLVAGSQVRTDVTAEALTELLRELGRADTITAEELEKARRLGRSEVVQELGAGVVEAMAHASDQVLGLSPDALARRLLAWDAVTLPQATQAAQAFEPKAFSVVLVGDRKRIEKALQKAFPGQAIAW